MEEFILPVAKNLHPLCVEKSNTNQPDSVPVTSTNNNPILTPSIQNMAADFKEIVAGRAVAMQRPRARRIYQGHFRATVRQTRSHRNRHERNNRRVVFYVVRAKIL
jgi:hypothetical protein